ncbi:hypothetical protein QBZ16_001415 [Prototheca wickerhamii]|uniref:YCII-related domain-containing protein n=1 Tax=Prototheca wickerhamii TaxID=3111 RepID=A0AAD9MG52_PROWI|nr:hypothetical protein QBZ16_001415 [Prototheca wickerhamii]
MATDSQRGYYALVYKYVPDMINKRDVARNGHLEHFQALAAKKKLAMGGAFLEPLDQGLLIFRDSTKEEVESYAQEDPYMKAGLITEWSVRKYAKVLGDVD